MKFLSMRFDAPMISFGAPIVDNRGEIQPYPALSMITGLIGNALGFEHREFDRLQNLQERLAYGSRQDRRGERIEDYQTVDLGADYMSDDLAWTTDGTLEERAGASGDATHIRHREYWADAIHTVAVTLERPGESPTLDDVGDALRMPERPLFVGRKTCLPARGLYLGRTEVDGWHEALREAPVPDRVADDADGSTVEMPIWRPVEPDADLMRAKPVTDRRDWENQIHVGERWIARDTLEISLTEGDDE
jgi:CRISPR system Cascade subunit CasD